MTLQQLLWELAAGESIELINLNHDSGRIVMRTCRMKNGERINLTTEKLINLHRASDVTLEVDVSTLIEEHRKHTR